MPLFNYPFILRAFRRKRISQNFRPDFQHNSAKKLKLQNCKKLNSVADFCKLIEAPLINVYTQYSDLELDVKQSCSNENNEHIVADLPAK